MLVVRLDPAIENKLSRLAQETGRSKSYYVKQAIESYLEEREDYLLALAVLERNEPRNPIAEVRRDLGLERWVYRNGRKSAHEARSEVAKTILDYLEDEVARRSDPRSRGKGLWVIGKAYRGTAWMTNGFSPRSWMMSW